MKNWVLLLVGVFALSGTVNAALISDTSDDGAGQDLQSLFDGWLQDSSDFDVNDRAEVHSSWSTGASDASLSKIIIEIAGNAGDNTFGMYDLGNVNNRLQIFDGPDGTGDLRTIEYLGGGEYEAWGKGTEVQSANLGGPDFGFYLYNPVADLLFLSDPTLNPNGDVQMVAFQGDGRQADFFGTGFSSWLSNEWVLAWEDLPYAESDQDFNDFVVMVESVHPVPEPMGLGLLGLGLVGLGIAARRRRGLNA